MNSSNFKSASGNTMDTFASPAPPPRDMAYLSTCPCYLYGVCSLLPPRSEGWSGGAQIDGKLEEEGGQPSDVYPYSPPGYMTFPNPAPVGTLGLPPIPPTPTVPVMTPSPSLIVVSPSSPSSPCSPPTKVPKRDEEEQDALHMMINGVENFQNESSAYPLQTSLPMPLPEVAAPPPFGYGPNGTSPQQFTEEGKLGVFGADGCWYSLAGINMNETDPNQHHLPAPPLQSSTPCYPYFPAPNHANVLPPPLHPFRDPAACVPPASTFGSLATSSPSSVSSLSYSTPPFSHSSSPSMPSEGGQNGILYYNHYQHLNIPTDVFGKPRLIASFKKEGQL